MVLIVCYLTILPWDEIQTVWSTPEDISIILAEEVSGTRVKLAYLLYSSRPSYP